jgi:hypothetical protein
MSTARWLIAFPDLWLQEATNVLPIACRGITAGEFKIQPLCDDNAPVVALFSARADLFQLSPC